MNNDIISKKENTMKGFKTFVLTLSISVVVFSTIYYLLGNKSESIDIDEFEVSRKQDGVALVTDEDVKGINDTNEESPFGKLNSMKKPEVLADTTETTTETVTTTQETNESTTAITPDTGSWTLIGTLLSTLFFSLALYVLFIGPRKLALSSFEDSMLNE